MIKSELVARLAQRYPHLYHRDVERIVSTVLDEIIKALSAGHRVELRGFGAFSVKVRPSRLGRNPRTGEPVTVDEKRAPFLPHRQRTPRTPERRRLARRGRITLRYRLRSTSVGFHHRGTETQRERASPRNCAPISVGLSLRANARRQDIESEACSPRHTLASSVSRCLCGESFGRRKHTLAKTVPLRLRRLL